MGPPLILRRREGWPERLDAFVAARRRTPFAWGANDCASFAIAHVEDQTGVAVWPVTWSTALAAEKVIAAAGGLADAMTSVLGPPSQNWRFARRADVALVDQAGRPAVMVCIGAELVGPGIDALESKPLSAARLVWRIG